MQKAMRLKKDTAASHEGTFMLHIPVACWAFMSGCCRADLSRLTQFHYSSSSSLRTRPLRPFLVGCWFLISSSSSSSSLSSKRDLCWTKQAYLRIEFEWFCRAFVKKRLRSKELKLRSSKCHPKFPMKVRGK